MERDASEPTFSQLPGDRLARIMESTVEAGISRLPMTCTRLHLRITRVTSSHILELITVCTREWIRPSETLNWVILVFPQRLTFDAVFSRSLYGVYVAGQGRG